MMAAMNTPAPYTIYSLDIRALVEDLGNTKFITDELKRLGLRPIDPKGIEKWKSRGRITVFRLIDLLIIAMDNDIKLDLNAYVTEYDHRGKANEDS